MSQYDPPAPPSVPQTPSAPPANPYAQPSPAANPYAPPQAQVGLNVQAPTNAEAVRREHLNHEASIRSIGLLYLIGGVIYVFSGVVVLIMGIFGITSEELGGESAFLLGTSVVIVLVALLFIWMGRGLRNLEEKVKLAVTIFAVIGLLGFPIGTLINAYILYLLHSEKGKRVLSAEYRAIRDQTPHIKYKTPLWMWILVGLIVFALVTFIALAIMG